jgi:hypothetical protein
VFNAKERQAGRMKRMNQAHYLAQGSEGRIDKVKIGTRMILRRAELECFLDQQQPALLDDARAAS